MSVTAIIPAIVCVAGLALWALGPDKLKTPALWAYGAGLIVWLFAVAGTTWKIG